MYRQSAWSPVVRLKGQAPVTGQVYQLERLRCHTCGEIFTAELPPEAGPDKYDPRVVAIVATLRYGEGMPGNRLQRIQQFAGVPLPASDQWELVRDAQELGPRDAYQHLLWLAAQGDLFHNDDTPMRVLELKGKTQRQQPLLEEAPERRGVFTTGAVSLASGRPTIALFFTGPHHAGENLRTLLESRRAELPPPIQMCDALSRNMPDDLRVIVANCLVHGRRNFYMSRIHTCYLSGVSPVDYLTKLQRHHQQVRDAPADWMPWNYRQQLGAAEATPEAGCGAPGHEALFTARARSP